jgi:hypothetical protein
VSALVTLTQAAPLLGCRDPRTARKRLAALAVPVLELGGRLFVDEADVLRARRAHARPLEADAPGTAGVKLALGERLWDGRGATKVGPRRVNGRPRDDRGVSPAAQAAYGTPSATPRPRRPPTDRRRNDEH